MNESCCYHSTLLMLSHAVGVCIHDDVGRIKIFQFISSFLSDQSKFIICSFQKDQDFTNDMIHFQAKVDYFH